MITRIRRFDGVWIEVNFYLFFQKTMPLTHQHSILCQRMDKGIFIHVRIDVKVWVLLRCPRTRYRLQFQLICPGIKFDVRLGAVPGGQAVSVDCSNCIDILRLSRKIRILVKCSRHSRLYDPIFSNRLSLFGLWISIIEV